MALPNFLVIATPKAGSTALHAALAQHPQLYLSAIKEPKFFLCDDTQPPHPRRGHSEKPDLVYVRIDRMYPGCRSGSCSRAAPCPRAGTPGATRRPACVGDVTDVGSGS